MHHYHVTILDTLIREAWFNQGRFGLSNALFTSARMKRHDSCGLMNVLA